MATAARDRLARTLRGDSETAFSTELSARVDALTLDVEGFGRVKFPVTPAKARKLIGLGKPARFGKGEETLTDPDVRDTWEVPKDLVTVTWDPGTLRDILATVKEDLGLPSAAELTADLHSVLVYEPNQFFLRHQDTEKSDEMIGTLVVTLPSTYAGGDLMVGQGKEWKAYRGTRGALSLVAFYADCQHEVLKIESGYRITLTYNLMLHGDTTPRAEGDAGVIAELGDLLREHFAAPGTPSWGRPAGPPKRLVYLLDHEYTPRALAWTRLKGADAQRVPLLRKAAEQAGYEAVLALADVKTTHDAHPADEGYGYRRRRYYDDDDYDAAYEYGAGAARDRKYEINELIDSEVTLTHWTGPDGARLEETSLSVRDAEACASTPHGDLEPYESEYEGYMGNWGNTLDRWYHRGAIVVWPRAQSFANRAETSPGWALDELASMAAAGGVAGAREAAATLEPFWDGLDRQHPARGEDGADNAAGLLGKALRAADAMADPGVAAMLLKPFTITSLARDHAEPLGRVTGAYGPAWADGLLRGWFGGDRPAWDRSQGQADWVAARLPGLCADLHATGYGETARRLLELSWDQIRQDAGTRLAISSPSYRDRRLAELGKPVAALLAAATTTGAASITSGISGFLTSADGDPVTVLQLAALRAALTADPALVPGTGLGELAADCAARLRGRLGRPRRDAGDWSVILPAGGCTCDLCGTLRDFLSAADQRTLQWPLAEQGRRHVHSRIDGAELPVAHATRREGRPYTLVLTKTSALHDGEQAARDRDEADLAWVTGCAAMTATAES